MYPLRKGVSEKEDRLQDKYDLILKEAKKVYEDISNHSNKMKYLRKDEKLLPKDVDEKKDKDVKPEA